MMHYQRHGHRDDRRRRVLLDDASSAALEEQPDSELGDAPQSAKKRLYTHAARSASQPRLTDLIPRRLRTCAGIVAILALSISIIQLLYLKLYLNPGISSTADLAAFNLNGPATLSGWFSVMTLLWTSAGCFLVYLHRRHKSDDYRGTYRWWMWTALVFGFFSLDAASGVHRIWESLVEQWNQPAWLADHPYLATSILYFACGVFLLTRLFSDARRSRVAMTALCVGSCCLITGIVHQLAGWQTGPSAEVTQSSLLLSGIASTGLFVWLIARQVYLEAHGLVRPKQRRTKSKPESEKVDKSVPEKTKQKKTKSRKRVKEDPDNQPKADPTPKDRKLRVDAAHTTSEPHDGGDEGEESGNLIDELEEQVSGKRNRKKRRKKRRKAG